MNNKNNTTPFSIIYDSFLSKITDDMFMELTELDTFRMLEELLMTAIHKFEFPRVNLNDYETQGMVDEGEYCGEESDYEHCIAYIYNDGYFNCSNCPKQIQKDIKDNYVDFKDIKKTSENIEDYFKSKNGLCE